MKIINFHGIGMPSRDLDPGEAPFWLSQEQFCAVLDRIVAHPDREHLAITFDDGNMSDLTIAAPELEARGLKATFFVLTGRLGQVGSLGWADVGALQARGMQIGSHGIDHRDLTAINPMELRNEMVRSKQTLEDICAVPVDAFAIPFGRYNSAVLRAAKSAGYRAAYSSDGGTAHAADFLRPRRSLRGDMQPKEIEHALSGRISMLRRLRRSVAMAVKRFA